MWLWPCLKAFWIHFRCAQTPMGIFRTLRYCNTKFRSSRIWPPGGLTQTCTDIIKSINSRTIWSRVLIFKTSIPSSNLLHTIMFLYSRLSTSLTKERFGLDCSLYQIHGYPPLQDLYLQTELHKSQFSNLVTKGTWHVSMGWLYPFFCMYHQINTMTLVISLYITKVLEFYQSLSFMLGLRSYFCTSSWAKVQS